NRFAPRLTAVLANTKAAATERAAATRALRTLGDKSAVAALKAVVAEDDAGNNPPMTALQAEALQALAGLDPAAGARAAEGLLDKKSPEMLRTAVQVLGGTPDGAKKVGKLFLDKRLPAELQAAVADGLRRHAEKDAEAAKLLGDMMKTALKLTLEPADVARVR